MIFFFLVYVYVWIGRAAIQRS